MKAEKCMEMLMSVVTTMTAAEKAEMMEYVNGYGKTITKDSYFPCIANGTIPTALGEMMRVLKIEMAKENEKTSGKSKQAAVIKNVLKTADNNNSKCQFTYIVENKQYVTDSYRIFEFNQICNSVPIKDDTSAIDGWIRMFHDRAKNVGNGELEIPDRAKLVAYIKAKKAELKACVQTEKNHPIIYSWGEGLPSITATFLLDVIDGLGDNIKGNYVNSISAMYFVGDNGSAIVMPIRVRDGNDKKTEL